MDQTKQFLEQWYQGYRSDDPEFLDSILDESVVFTSPIVFNPIEGKAMTKMYLMGAGITFNMVLLSPLHLDFESSPFQGG